MQTSLTGVFVVIVCALFVMVPIRFFGNEKSKLYNYTVASVAFAGFAATLALSAYADKYWVRFNMLVQTMIGASYLTEAIILTVRDRKKKKLV